MMRDAAVAEYPSPPSRAEREGPIAQQWEGEVGAGERSGIPTSPRPSPPPGAEREKREGAEPMRRVPNEFGGPGLDRAAIATALRG